MAERFGRVGLLFHPRVAPSERLAHELARVAEGCGCEAWVASAWERDELYEQAGGCGLLVTLGGDGTILRVARAALSREGAGPRHTPPLLTVDFGTLGFLTELAPPQATEALHGILCGGAFWLEERRLLRATLVRDGATVAAHDAMNDVVLARGDGPHAIRLTMFIDDAEAARYTADGMIVASPTGSTAYALGAGGPIMGPDVVGMVAVPVAPHLAVVRSFVVAPASRITLQATAYKSTVVTLDGQTTLPYEAGDLLHITQSDAVARFVRLGPKNYFYATLQDKLRRG